MAPRGYLGKISAVVAINTGGVKPSLNATAKDIQSWGRTVQSRLSGTSDAAKRAFDGIFTPLQKLQAAVKAANRQPLDLKIPNVRSFLDLAKATEQIAKPLGNAQKQLTGLSQGVQSQLLPALVSAQKQASGLFDAIANGARITERDFANTEARINRVVQAISRANEASQATRGLATGQELRFQNPEFLRSTSRAAQLQQQAAQLSPEAISSRGIVSLIGRQKLAADEAERLRATLERTIATRNGDQESARRAYTQQLAYLDQVNARLERQIQLERQAGEINDNIGASTQLRSTTDPTGRSIQQRIQDTLRLREAEDARARAARESAEADEIAARSAQLRSQAAGQLLNVLQRESQLLSNEGAASTTDSTGRSIQQRAEDIARLRAAEEDRARAARESAEADEIAARSAQLRSQAAGQLLNVLQRESQLLSNEGAASTTDSTGRSIQQRAEDIRNQTIEENVGAFSRRATNVREYIALLERERQAAEAASEAEAEQQRRREAASRFLRVDQQGSDIASNEGRSTPLTGNRAPRTRVLGQLGQEVGDLRSRLRGVGETLAGDIGPTVDNLTTRFQNMARQGVGVAAEEARRLSQEVAGINAALNNRQSIGERFESSFGGAGRAGLSLGVDERSLRGIGAQIEFVQGRLSTLRQEVRGPVIAALDAFRVRSQQLFRGGEINTDAGRRQLRLLQDELARTLSAAGGGSVRRINEQLRRVGDIARGSFGNVGLAIQQAIFAFDDFFSVTGGLDQRIRAAGNNISQLGFILGGTAGLIGGVLVSALAQAAAGLVKWANSGAGSVEIAKALNERLERQKSLLGEITSGFNELADGVGENAFSEASRRAADFESRLTSVIDKLKEFRDSAATALNADVFMADGVVESRQGRLREAGTLPLAAARQALLRDAERSAEQARVRARSAPAMSRQELQDAFGGGYTAPASTTNEMLRGTLEERQSDLARVVDSWFYTFVTPFEQANARRQIVIVSRARDNLVATIASNIEQITRGVVGPAARRFDATANRTGEMLGRANEVGGPSGDVTAARDALEGDTRAFRDALTRLGKAAAAGRETEVQSLAKFLEALSRSVVAREREARALLAAANASARFVEVLGRLREANDAIFGDISNVASQARRDALQAAGSADSGLSRRSDADFAQARSDRLQQELRAAEDRRTAAESALRDAERRFRFESPDPSIRQLVNEAASLRSVIESPQTAPQAAASARQRELFVNDQLNRAFASSPMGRALQDQVDEAARAAGSVLARDSMITQGRELSMTPGERSARELEDNLRRINAFFDDEVQRLGFPFQGREEIEQRREEARRRLIADQMRNTAPTIFGLADSVANALLQGPSRAALQATDVSTVEGSRELTRLLRGDDAARDQANLVELQREANRLLDIIANAPAPVAN